MVGEDFYPLESAFYRLLAQWGGGPLEEETIVIFDGSEGIQVPEADLKIQLGAHWGPGIEKIEADFQLASPSASQLWGLLMAWKGGMWENGGLVSGGLQPRAISKEWMPETMENVTPTPKEKSVLEQLLAGESNKGIAFNLGLSVSTVKFHLKNLMQKTGAASRSEVLMMAVRRGWVSL